MKIGQKIIMWFMLFTIIPWAIISLIVYFSMVKHFEDLTGKNLKDNVVAAAAAIDQFMTTRIQDLNSFSNSPIFELNKPNEVSKHLSSIVDAYPFYDDLIFANIKGKIISSSKRGKIGKNLFDLEGDIENEFMKTVDGGSNDVFVSDLSDIESESESESETLDLEILSDVRNSIGETIGVLIGMVNIQLIKELVYSIDDRTIGTEYAYLVDDPGNILITADPNVTILSPHPDLNIKNLKRKLEGDQDGFVIYANSKGRKVISGYADLKEYGSEGVGDWSLLSTAPYDDIMAPLHKLFFNISIILFVVIATTIIIGLFIVRTISSPIIKLKDAAEKLGKGEIISDIEINSKDEVGQLANSFNKMARDLQKGQEETKKRISAEATAVAEKENADRLTILNQELKETTTQLVQGEKLKAIGELASGICHELNQPLNVVKIIAQSTIKAINKGKSNDESNQKEFMKIVTQINKASEIINHMRVFSRNTVQGTLEKIDINIVVDEALKFGGDEAKTFGIEIIKDLNTDLPPVWCDTVRLEQVFLNILNNSKLALKNKGNDSKKIEVRSYQLEGKSAVAVAFSDNGPGVPSDLQEKIFYPFFTTREQGEGTGLGLSISKKIIEEHKGEIELESKEGKGATFRVILPIAESMEVQKTV